MTAGAGSSRFLAPLVLLIVTFLAGCATSTYTEAPSEDRRMGDWKSQQARLEALTSFKASGKVGIRTPEQSESANLDWIQSPERYRLSVSGPWGAARNTLEGGPDGVTLANGDGTFEAATPEALMRQQLGWSLPISSLDRWVRGLPAPDRTFDMQRDDRGFPAVLEQNGWHIEYRDWSLADGLWLPRRMVMTYDDIRTTLIIHRWQPGQAFS